jgi:hypothetical protein
MPPDCTCPLPQSGWQFGTCETCGGAVCSTVWGASYPGLGRSKPEAEVMAAIAAVRAPAVHDLAPKPWWFSFAFVWNLLVHREWTHHLRDIARAYHERTTLRHGRRIFTVGWNAKRNAFRFDPLERPPGAPLH